MAIYTLEMSKWKCINEKKKGFITENVECETGIPRRIWIAKDALQNVTKWLLRICFLLYGRGQFLISAQMKRERGYYFCTNDIHTKFTLVFAMWTCWIRKRTLKLTPIEHTEWKSGITRKSIIYLTRSGKGMAEPEWGWMVKGEQFIQSVNITRNAIDQYILKFFTSTMKTILI